MPEVKKPRALRLGHRGSMSAKDGAWKIGRRAWIAEVSFDGRRFAVNANLALRVAAWFTALAAWLRSLEPEFDERN